MATLLMRTADVRDMTLTNAYSGIELSSEQARTGSYSYKVSGLNAYCTFSFAGKSTLYFRIALRSASGDPPLINFRESSTIHVQFQFNITTGEIDIYRNGTLLGSTVGAGIVPNAWFCIEGKIIIHDSTGEFTLKVNGSQKASLTSKDTQNGGVGTVDNIMLTQGFYGVYYADDICIDDAAYPGTGGIEVLAVTADGTNTAWAASAGSDYQCVDENPPSATDYVSTDAGTTGTKESFALGDLSITPAAIPRVGLLINALLDGAGTGNLTPFILSNSNEANGTAKALGTSALWAEQYADTDAGHSSEAWTKTYVDAIEAGFKTS